MKRQDLIPIFAKIRPLPHVATRILAAVDDEAVTTGELAALVRHDMTLYAQVLKVANSSYYGLRTEVDSIDRAITLLGRRALVQIVVASCAGGTLQGAEHGYYMDRGSLFRHGMAAAAASELLGKQITHPNPGLVFSACLLQNLGKVVLDEWVASEGSGLAHQLERGASFVEAESEILGVDHAQVGAWLAEEWSFPAELVDAIRWHHQPARADNPTVARIVHFTDTLCMLAGVGAGYDGLAYRVEENLEDKIGLTDHQVGELVIGLAERLAGLDEMLTEALPT
jgi:HD-like signal output (HDOD) protein